MINGNTELIAHIGYPTYTFKSPMIYNPYFEKKGINAVVMPMGCKSIDYPVFLRSVFQLANIRGALITMPHKVVTVDLVDEVTPTVKVAGACIAASLAASEIKTIALFDSNSQSAEKLGDRLNTHFPAVEVLLGRNDPEGFDLIVNATPLGMKEGDPMPVDINKISPESFVGEVVLKAEMTAFLQAANKRGCKVQIGSDMLFEQIPVYLEYFGFESTTADELRLTAKLDY